MRWTSDETATNHNSRAGIRDAPRDERDSTRVPGQRSAADAARPGVLPQRGEVSRAALPVSLSASGLARRHAAAAMREWGLSSDLISTAVLLVSELVTNAANALAAKPADLYSDDTDPVEADEIRLALRLLRDRLVIEEVFDTDRNYPRPLLADAESESGRGLMLIEALAKEWGCAPLAGGKVVYCVISDPSLIERSPGSHRLVENR